MFIEPDRCGGKGRPGAGEEGLLGTVYVGELNCSAPAHGGQIQMNMRPELLNLLISVTDNTHFYVKYDVQMLVTSSKKLQATSTQSLPK